MPYPQTGVVALLHHRVKPALAATFIVLALMLTSVGSALAQNNQQSGLVNVNVQDLSLALPVSVAVPVSVAADVCGVDVNVLASQIQNGPVSCAATSNSSALSDAVAAAMTGQNGPGGGGGGANNQQSGLVNVNVQNVALAIPVSVAVPIGVAANVCGVDANVLASDVQNGSASCDATSTSQALSNAIGAAMAP